MARSKTSDRWLREHFLDTYVKKSWQDGYRSRAAYKLLELDERDRLLRPGLVVIDLGAAPGGWSQVVAAKVGAAGRVVATDILPMDEIVGVTFIQGDFREQTVFDQLVQQLDGQRAGLVISDMAPNISGVPSVDQPRAMYLAELALDLARKTLTPDGDLLVKVFQGVGFEEFQRAVRSSFSKVMIRKPKASRAQSREVYMLARGFVA